ncbi:HD domain-containing protein [Clostridium sp. SM-530-WT-3G]|uniref:HD domain-containing protein n=1 Tax=Clostridium sp. SM-530-WT-3G TaxID=2725303 RepID=UPI00145F94AC|nr:HD domain-containing protein [Clostridium sp. SM-530-WT-3G]NME82062.1 HD domain-containing protein [Clostridium sp. SM-530-WT-3G]
MTVAEVTKKMIEYSNGNLHDINHFMKVYGYAKTISECENVDADTKEILEVAALLHDIACPLCREKYGNTNGKYQEEEGKILTAEFLKDTGYSEEFINRVVYLVGHHHTLTDIKGEDYQILIEADYLVNADESNYSKENIKNMLEKVFKTSTGISLLKSMYGIE